MVSRLILQSLDSKKHIKSRAKQHVEVVWNWMSANASQSGRSDRLYLISKCLFCHSQRDTQWRQSPERRKGIKGPFWRAVCRPDYLEGRVMAFFLSLMLLCWPRHQRAYRLTPALLPQQPMQIGWCCLDSDHSQITVQSHFNIILFLRRCATRVQ